MTFIFEGGSRHSCSCILWKYKCFGQSSITWMQPIKVCRLFAEKWKRNNTEKLSFSPGHGGNSILHYAAMSTNLETVRFCLGQGMQANWWDLKIFQIYKTWIFSLNYEGETPLHLISETHSKSKVFFYKIDITIMSIKLYSESHNSPRTHSCWCRP